MQIHNDTDRKMKYLFPEIKPEFFVEETPLTNFIEEKDNFNMFYKVAFGKF